jgi:hypothetical protein
MISLFGASGSDVYKRVDTKEEAIEMCRNSGGDVYESWHWEEETDIKYLRDSKIDKILKS